MTIDNETKELVRKLALKNALDYGSARYGPILAKLIARSPELKESMRELSPVINRIVSEVNSMPRSSLEKEYEKHASEFEELEAERAERSARHSFRIEGAEKGKFVTRFPPEPGGYMHIGHAKPVFIEAELRSAYKGKVMLYFDDTNPDNESQEYVDAFKDDLKWLGVSFDGEYYASDNIGMLYDYAKEAIKKKGAYVCTCSGDEMREKRLKGEPCIHKGQGAEENGRQWKRMLDSGYADGEAVLRLNSDMKAVNTTMRDPTLFRIKHARHYRQGEKYSVWPTYDFCTPIIDSVKGVTDVARSKEYEMRDELYFDVLSLLSLRKPRITSFSRLEISDNVTSKRKLRELISQRLVSGWDDPRLVTIRALRRRGVRAEAIREFALGFGMGKSESTADIDVLLAINRKIIDKEAKRLFFIEDPVELHVQGLGESAEVSMKLHPGRDLGYRRYKVDGELFINAPDSKLLHKGDTVRLKDALSIRIKSIGKRIEAECSGAEPGGLPRLQWITRDGAMKCELLHIGNLMKGDEFNSESIRRTAGYAEAYASGLAEGEIVQFERLGFFKLDSKERSSFISL